MVANLLRVCFGLLRYVAVRYASCSCCARLLSRKDRDRLYLAMTRRECFFGDFGFISVNFYFLFGLNEKSSSGAGEGGAGRCYMVRKTCL